MNVDYEDLLEKIISTFFKKNNFTLKGKLIWNNVSKKENERYFKKNGEELKNKELITKLLKYFGKINMRVNLIKVICFFIIIY